VSYVFQKTATANSWTLNVLDDKGNTMLPTSGSPAVPTLVNVAFDAAGVMTSPTMGTPATPGAFQFTPPSGTFPSWAGPVTVDLTGMSQFGGKHTVAASAPTVGGGSAQGSLESFSLGNDGSITGVYSNGLRQVIGQLALANFANPSGLTKSGNSSYAVGDNSGSARIGVAGTGGRGTLTAGALEMSNVDLAQEFTGLIIAQRGFQANSKVITTSDQILQDLVQMKQ
jgi:flagellar hook protein FlgE